MEVDPTLANLLVSYAANVGADATRWATGKFRRPSAAPTERGAADLNLSIQSQLTADGIESADAERVAAFLLETPILGYLFMLVEEASGVAEYEGYPHEEITALFALEAGLNEAAASAAAATVVAVLGASIRSGARLSRRPATIRARRLSGIQLFGAQDAKRRLLRGVGTPSLEDIREYSSNFRRDMQRKFSRIQLQHLDDGTEQRLDDLYVEPDLLLQESEPDETDGLRPAEVLNYARAVIQGPAGSGKSTTVRRLAAALAAEDGYAIPIVVELRKYSAQQELRPQILLEHICRSAALLTQQTPPDSWLEYILITGRAVVFFDGLDEVLNAGTRADVRDAVLSFSQVFPASSFVVTSRFTGYDLAPLDRSEWTHLAVGELREDQVRDYASRWFKLRHSGSDFTTRAESFIEESRTYARDLRANPLMLSLLCSVYFMRGDIPRTLHELYERCADMIYQQWNTMRGIEDHRAWDKDVRPILYQIAHTVLNDDDYLSFGIPEDELTSELRRAFIANGAPDEEEASRRARETVHLWAGRAWILTVVMAEKSSRPRYGFVHQSFLEYFAAVYEVRRVDAPADLYHNLRGRLIELNGLTVTQIAVSVLNAWRDRGGERFLEALLAEVDEACDLDALPLLRFAISLASVIHVPQEQLAQIAADSVNLVARSVMLPLDEDTTFEVSQEADELVRAYETFERERSASSAEDMASRRRNLRLPTAESDAVLEDLAEMSVRVPGAQTTVAHAVLECLKTESDEVALAALLTVAVLKSGDAWPADADSRGEHLISTRAPGSWVVQWAAAQVDFVSIAEASTRVPWHALLLIQELARTEKAELYGPEPFARDLVASMNDVSTRSLLESVGTRASHRHASGLALSFVSSSQAAANFTFGEPSTGWLLARETDQWSDAFLVVFAMLGKLASLAWKTGLAMGEFVNDSPRPLVRHIAAVSAGWGSVDEALLNEISEPYRSTIRNILSTSWPADGGHPDD